MIKWLAGLFGKKAVADSVGSTPQKSTFPADMSDHRTNPDQFERKARSEALLVKEDVPLNTWLPMIESEEETESRSPDEIAQRLLALVAVAVKGEGVDQRDVDAFVEKRSVRPFFSPAEAAFMAIDEPDERSRIQFSWQYECAWVMLWALKLTDTPLGLPRQICDVTYLAETVRDAHNLAGNGVRSVRELLDEADLIYRCHWAVRQASLDGSGVPGRLDGGVAMERHRALNWLIRYDEADWDDVTTDT